MANQCFPCDSLTQKPARLPAPGANSVSGPVFPTLTWLRKPEKHPKNYLFSLTGEGLLCDFVIDAVANMLWKQMEGYLTPEHSTD